MPVIDQLLSGGVKGLLDGAGDFATKIRSAITGKSVLTADQIAELEKLSQQHQAELAVQSAELNKALIDAGMREADGQVELDKIEAQSQSLFKSGWRPSVGWVCVAGLVYTFLIQPLFPWVAGLISKTPIADLPKLDTNVLMTLLFGMLGLGGMRSFEKLRKVS